MLDRAIETVTGATTNTEANEKLLKRRRSDIVKKEESEDMIGTGAGEKLSKRKKSLFPSQATENGAMIDIAGEKRLSKKKKSDITEKEERNPAAEKERPSRKKLSTSRDGNSTLMAANKSQKSGSTKRGSLARRWLQERLKSGHLHLVEENQASSENRLQLEKGKEIDSRHHHVKTDMRKLRSASASGKDLEETITKRRSPSAKERGKELRRHLEANIAKTLQSGREKEMDRETGMTSRSLYESVKERERHQRRQHHAMTDMRRFESAKESESDLEAIIAKRKSEFVKGLTREQGEITERSLYPFTRIQGQEADSGMKKSTFVSTTQDLEEEATALGQLQGLADSKAVTTMSKS